MQDEKRDGMTEAEWKELEEKGQPKNLKRNKARVQELLAKTEKEDEHPDDYNGPCYCRTCASYGD